MRKDDLIGDVQAGKHTWLVLEGVWCLPGLVRGYWRVSIGDKLQSRLLDHTVEASECHIKDTALETTGSLQDW